MKEKKITVMIYDEENDYFYTEERVIGFEIVEETENE